MWEAIETLARDAPQHPPKLPPWRAHKGRRPAGAAGRARRAVAELAAPRPPARRILTCCRLPRTQRLGRTRGRGRGDLFLIFIILFVLPLSWLLLNTCHFHASLLYLYLFSFLVGRPPADPRRSARDSSAASSSIRCRLRSA